MKAVIKYQIYEISENNGYHNGKTVPQKIAKMNVVAPLDPNDPNYIYGQVSGGSSQTLSTTNPNVFNTWFVGAIITCEMEVEVVVE
jgi:hypothetical protein